MIRMISLRIKRGSFLSLILLLALAGCSKGIPEDSVDSKPPEMMGDEGKMVPPP